MSNMRRVQMLIEPDRHDALSKIAKQENTSVSEIIRDALTIWMTMREEKIKHTKRLEAVKKIGNHRKKILENRGGKYLRILPETLLEEVREERLDEKFAATSKGSD